MARTPARFVGSIGLTNVGRFADQVVGIFPDAVADATTQTLLPDLFDESVDTFFASQVNLKVFPGLYVDPDTFFAPKISRNLKPGLYTDTDTFFAPKVSHGLKPGLYADVDTFFTPTVTQPSGGQTLFPTLFVSNSVFFSPVVKGRYTLTPSLYADADTFFGPVVKGRYTLTPTLYFDPDTFFTSVISQGPGGDQGLSPGNFFSLAFFFDSDIEGGDAPEEETPQGGGKQHKYHKLESSDVHSVLRYGDDVRIRYNDGKVYNYSDVSEKKFNKLVNARSPGSFVHKNIKEKHAYRRFS